MSLRKSLAAMAATAVLGASTLLASGASDASQQPWSFPTPVAGTDAFGNVSAALAPDGTDLALTIVAGSSARRSAIVGKIRLPGETVWRSVPNGPEGKYLGIGDIAPTDAGDFWIAYGTGSDDYASFLVRFDAQSRRWSTPIRLFKDQKNHYHGNPSVELAADGTLVVAAYSPPKVEPPGDPIARLSVGTRSPGGQWKNRFLTPADDFIFRQELAANRAGDVAISFIQGYQLTDMRVRAGTKAGGKNSRWKVSTLSPRGDSQDPHVAIGADGTAAVVWSSSSQAPDAIKMSTTEVRRELDPWVGRTVIAGVPVVGTGYGVVNRRGEATAVWQQSGGIGTRVLWSRLLDDGGLGVPLQLTPALGFAVLTQLIQQPNGKAGLLYERFNAGSDSLALEYRTLDGGIPGPVQELLGPESSVGRSNNEFLGIDAAGDGTAIYLRGGFPFTDVVWLSQSQSPSVMSGPATGTTVDRARVAGALRIGSKATCVSGYWVEVSSVNYRWERNGNRIIGETSKRYRLVNRDNRERISCQVIGSDSMGGKLTLASPARRAG